MAKPECIDSRIKSDGLRWRRYRKDNGDIHVTVEVPADVYWGRIADSRALKRKGAFGATKRQIIELLQQGKTITEVAQTLQCDMSYVRKIHLFLDVPA